MGADNKAKGETRRGRKRTAAEVSGGDREEEGRKKQRTEGKFADKKKKSAGNRTRSRKRSRDQPPAVEESEQPQTKKQKTDGSPQKNVQATETASTTEEVPVTPNYYDDVALQIPNLPPSTASYPSTWTSADVWTISTPVVIQGPAEYVAEEDGRRVGSSTYEEDAASLEEQFVGEREVGLAQVEEKSEEAADVANTVEEEGTVDQLEPARSPRLEYTYDFGDEYGWDSFSRDEDSDTEGGAYEDMEGLAEIFRKEDRPKVAPFLAGFSDRIARPESAVLEKVEDYDGHVIIFITELVLERSGRTEKDLVLLIKPCTQEPVYEKKMLEKVETEKERPQYIALPYAISSAVELTEADVKWEAEATHKYFGLYERVSPVGDMSVLPLEEKRRAAEDLLRGLRYISEELGLCHADIKPENVAVSPRTGRYVYFDFGISFPNGGSPLNEVDPFGSDMYRAEEVENLIGNYDQRVDIFSLGRVFEKNLKIPQDQASEFCLKFQKLVGRMVQKERAQRISSARECLSFLFGDAS